jgi:hypothetical protein
MPTSPDVDRFIADLEHPRREQVQRLRLAILDSDDGIAETIKWNAPNFRFGGDDRVTFRLKPGDIVQLILHRGAKVRHDSAAFVFIDDAGLIKWAATDRGVVTLSASDSAEREAEIVNLVGRWMAA